METLLLVGAILSAIAYAGVITVLLWSNPKNEQAWSIAIVALFMWPWLFFMSVMQLIVVIPLITVFAINGRDLSKPLSTKAIYWSIASTVCFIAIVAAIAMLHDSSNAAW